MESAVPPSWSGPFAQRPVPPSAAPSPELRQQYQQQPIPGWQPYETDPLSRRVDRSGPEWTIPYYGVLGRGLRYKNPMDEDRFVPSFGHTVFMPAKEADGMEPANQRGLEIGAKSVLSSLSYGTSLFEDYLHSYMFEKNAMNPRILALSSCGAIESMLLECMGLQRTTTGCKQNYLELLNCAGRNLFPGEAEEILELDNPYEQQARKDAYIRNIVEVFLDRDRYSMEELDFYYRRTAHCDGFFDFEPEEEDNTFALSMRYAMGDEDEDEDRSEDLDEARLGCVLPMVCPKPLDQYMKCLVAEEGNETPCWRHYKRLLACGYSYAMAWVRDGSWGSIFNMKDNDYEMRDTGLSIFNTGIYRMFHNDPDTIPTRELEEDRTLAEKQLQRLAKRKEWAKKYNV